MAFLCPVRIRRSKKQKDCEKEGIKSFNIGRITGSASIETLVRVGIEKEQGLSPDSKMIVLVDFSPCVDDELEVKRGDTVNVLYQENDWAYVINNSNHLQGFVPHSFLAPYGSELGDLVMSFKSKKNCDHPSENVTDISGNKTGYLESLLKQCNKVYIADNFDEVSKNKYSRNHDSLNSLQSQISQPEVHHFLKVVDIHIYSVIIYLKDPAGRFIVLYTFVARDENDVSVERGEFITVLNHDDPDWFWIVRSDGQEGFIPSGFVYPAEIIQRLGDGNHTSSRLPQVISENVNDLDEMRYHGTELVMLYDYKAQAPDDLSVKRGDWVYADLTNQTVEGWLWAFAPKTRKYGFIPKAYARPPAMTSL